MADTGSGWPGDPGGGEIYTEYVEYLRDNCTWRFVKRYGSAEPYSWVTRILAKSEYAQYGITPEAVRALLVSQGYTSADIEKALTCTFSSTTGGTGGVPDTTTGAPPKSPQPLKFEPWMITVGAGLVLFMMFSSGSKS